MYSEELAVQICAELSKGKSLKRVCEGDGMPNVDTIFSWLHKKQDFAERYARAKEESADLLAEEILEIADDATNDWMKATRKDGSEYEKFNKEHVQRSRLRVDTRKWIAAKLKPKKYGDRIQAEITGADGGPIQIEDRQAIAKLAAMIESARRRAIEGECVDVTDQKIIEDGSDLI